MKQLILYISEQDHGVEEVSSSTEEKLNMKFTTEDYECISGFLEAIVTKSQATIQSFTAVVYDTDEPGFVNAINYILILNLP